MPETAAAAQSTVAAAAAQSTEELPELSPIPADFWFKEKIPEYRNITRNSATTIAAWMLMAEHNVSSHAAPKLFTALVELLGFRVRDTAPAQSFMVEALRLGGGLSRAEIGLQVAERARTSPQQSTVVIDAMSMQDDKFEGIAFVHKSADGTFTRMALPIVKLSSSSDVQKMKDIKVVFNDVINWTNTVHAGYAERLTLFDFAAVAGASVNDHAESVVKNQYIPWVQQELAQHIGTAQHVAAYKSLALTFVEHQGAGPAPVDVIRHIMESAFGRNLYRVKCNFIAEYRCFCANHKLHLLMDSTLKGLAKAQSSAAIQRELTDKDKAALANHFNGSSQAAVIDAVRSTAKLAGRPKAYHETLSHGNFLRAIRNFYSEAHLHFERLLGSRGDSAIFSNALPTLVAFLDQGDWGMNELIVKLESKSKTKGNRLHDAVGGSVESDLTLAELRVCALLHHALLRPTQTYIQNHSSQKDIVKLLKEYKVVLQKLIRVQKLTLVGDFPELPWLGNSAAIISVAQDPKVLHKHTQQRRTESVQQAIRCDGLSAERQALQVKLMVPMLREMAKGMAKELTELTSKKYGGIFNLADNDPRLDHLDIVPGTSDDIERYFGRASWLRANCPQFADRNLTHLLSIQEVKMGSKLARLVVADRARADEVLQRGRKLSAQFNSVLKAREDGLLEEMAEILRQAEADAETAANAKRAERAAREKLAREWVHLPLESARRRSTERTLRGLVEEHIRPRIGPRPKKDLTEKQEAEAVRKYVGGLIQMFGDVHGLATVDKLKHVFVGEWVATHDTGVGKSIFKGRTPDKLLSNLFDCSSYVHVHGSPAGFT